MLYNVFYITSENVKGVEFVRIGPTEIIIILVIVGILFFVFKRRKSE